MGFFSGAEDFYTYIHLTIHFFIVLFSFRALINEKVSFQCSLKCILFIFFPTIALYVFSEMLGMIYLYIAIIIFFSFRYHKGRVFFYVTSIFVSAFVAEQMTSLLLSSFQLENEFIKIIFFDLVFILILILFLLILKFYIRIFQMRLKLSIKVNGIITSILIIVLIFFYYNTFIIIDRVQIMEVKINSLFVLLHFMFLILFISIIFYMFMKEEKARSKEIKNEFLHEYVVSLEETNRKMQKFQHDYTNILLSLKGYIDSEDWDGLKTYFEKGILKFERKTILENKAFGDLKNIHIMSLKGLLLIKSLRAIDENLKLTIEVADPIEDISIDPIDLNCILGNLIDNAIEHCVEEGKDTIQIAIVKLETSSILFRIRNELGDTEINIAQIFQRGYTTKTSGQGIGLYNVKSIVDKMPNLNLNVWFEDGWFNAELIVLGGK